MALFFLVRIELHGASQISYDSLHTAMSNAGFRQQITTDQNEQLRLPSAEYAYFGGTDSAGVLALAQPLVQSIWGDSEILVCEVNSWWSAGLRRA